VSPFLQFAPAKLNLFLAVTGRRADGFHDLVSLVAPLTFGDTLKAEPADGFSLACAEPGVPLDATNLVLKAAAAYAEAAAVRGRIGMGAKFFLEKRIPAGAGLGGGSSDAVAALRLLNRFAGPGRGLDEAELSRVAARVGSDCPLFLPDAPVVMRGRGERVTALPAAVAARLRGRRVIVFKPGFGIPTPWAFGRIAAVAPAGYLPAAEAEARLAAWIDDPAAPLENLLFNNLEAPAFAKYVALPVLLERLREDFGLAARMSGSGSACFAPVGETTDVRPILAAIQGAWGPSTFAIEARLA
jgi:4-diphosphocytidyl-2-C-methyl-D-erythritol kinase